MLYPWQKRIVGKYFEEISIGDEWITPARTLTETDLMTYCYLSGDYNPVHTDIELMKKSEFGERIFHGMAITSFTSGLVERLSILEGSVVALLEINWKFRAPAKIGDTIRVVIRIAEKRETKRTDAGLVATARTVLNQNDVVVTEGLTRMLWLRRPHDLKE